MNFLSWNHNHVAKLIPQLVILLLQACPFQCLFCHLEISRAVYDRKYYVQDMWSKIIVHPWAGLPPTLGKPQKYASKSCLIWVLPNAEVPTSSLYPPLQFLNLSWIDSNLRHHAPKGCGHVFLTQLLKSIKHARLGQESRNMSTADIVNSGCSLPLEGK